MRRIFMDNGYKYTSFYRNEILLKIKRKKLQRDKS